VNKGMTMRQSRFIRRTDIEFVVRSLKQHGAIIRRINRRGKRASIEYEERRPKRAIGKRK
jgi:hypothetical protein